jgi:hypothetical protein
MQRFKRRIVLTILLLICLALIQHLSAKAADQCKYFLLSGTVPADATTYANFIGTWGYSPSPSTASLITFAPGTPIHAKLTHSHPANAHFMVEVGSYSTVEGEWHNADGPAPLEFYFNAPSYPNPDPLSGGNWFLMNYEVRGWYYLGRDGRYHDDGIVNYTLSILGDCL